MCCLSYRQKQAESKGVAHDYLLLGKEIISEPTVHNLHLLVNPQLRKKVGRTNPLINMGDREGALKGLKTELGGYEGAIDGENQGRGGSGTLKSVTGEII